MSYLNPSCHWSGSGPVPLSKSGANIAMSTSSRRNVQNRIETARDMLRAVRFQPEAAKVFLHSGQSRRLRAYERVFGACRHGIHRVMGKGNQRCAEQECRDADRAPNKDSDRSHVIADALAAYFVPTLEAPQ